MTYHYDIYYCMVSAIYCSVVTPLPMQLVQIVLST